MLWHAKDAELIHEAAVAAGVDIRLTAAEAIATVRSRGIRLLFLTNEPNGLPTLIRLPTQSLGIPATAMTS